MSLRPSPEPTASAPRSLPRGTQDNLPGEHPPAGRTQELSVRSSRGKPLGVAWLVACHSYPRPPYGNKTYTSEGKKDNTH